MQPALDVSCDLVLSVEGPVQLALQVVAAGGHGSLDITVDGVPARWTALHTGLGTRTQLLDVDCGEVVVRYAARIPARPLPTDVPTALDRMVYLRPSRYAPSDALCGLAAELLGPRPDDLAERAAAVCELVRRRTAYVLGSSGPTDTALETLLGGQGVCRDFAHLVVALCRAVEVPARLTAVYAPGLSPMDFHAVAEVALHDGWYVLDATGLAPRTSLARISTGRDAADTAFLTTNGNAVELRTMQVSAVTVGDLPWDDQAALVRLA